MLIFEAVEALKEIKKEVVTEISIFSSRQPPKVRFMLQSMLVHIADVETYREMSLATGKVLVEKWLWFLEQEGHLFDELGAIVLNRVSCTIPQALEGQYMRLLRRSFGAAYGNIFRLADAEVRDHILAFLEDNSPVHNQHEYEEQQMLAALAWIGDQVVQARFAMGKPFKKGSHNLSFQSLMQNAGWELTAQGQRRDLYYHSCFSLILNEQGNEEVSSPVKTGRLCEERCRGCGRHLFALFDCDLRAPVLSFFSIHGSHLRMAMCPTCTMMGELVYIDVDWDGSVYWSVDTGEDPIEEPLEDLNDWEDMPALRPAVLVLGTSRPTPYETYRAHTQEGLSQFGGFPSWIQTPEYPLCPKCQQTMKFVGQCALVDILPQTEGILYAFLCVECKKAVITFQQS